MIDVGEGRTEAARQRVIGEQNGAAYCFTLNRPEALNAFDDGMRRVIAETIPAIARNPDIYIVLLRSASPKAFCAGGDVRALSLEAKTDMERVRSYFRGEYAMNWLLECFSKPTVSFVNGLCMGSGAGLTLYNTHRVAGENYKFAMPEAAIGLFPDVGVAHPLSRLRWPVGLYLGLTGRSIGRADAHWLGLATHCIDESRFDDISKRLADAEPVDPLLDGLHQSQAPGPLQTELPMVEEYFSEPDIKAILRKLNKPSAASSNWAAQTLETLLGHSPMSLAITDRHIRAAKTKDLRETLLTDYRVAVRCLEAPDFAEGVRAALIDKDKKPKWSPADLDQIPDAAVSAYFAPLANDDFTLPSRSEMQAARV